MNEVKLLVLYMRKRLMSHTESDVFYEIEMPDYRPATTAEIMDAHPKCGECKWFRDGQFGEYCGYFALTVLLRVDAKDYCRHWEAKG